MQKGIYKEKEHYIKDLVAGLYISGGGVNLVLFMVRGRAIFRGTFFKPLRNHG